MCLKGTLSCVDFMDVIMGDIPVARGAGTILFLVGANMLICLVIAKI